MARAVETVRQQAEQARRLGARMILGLATEGVRAAANGTELIARVRDEAGLVLALVTGEQEAALTYWGATSGMGGVAERQAVVDLGGGSLELVVGEGTAVQWRVSLPLGSGTVTDRYAASDPPTADELATVGRVVGEELARLEPPPVRRAIACGGTATTLVMLASAALGGSEEERAARTLDETRMAALLDLVQREPASELSRRYGVDPARARLLWAGCVVLREAMRRVGADRLEVSRRGIREGAILAYIHTGDGWLEAATLGAGWQ
jgi:exopolyphosphatase/guanosine-5'-triphosphate,3'-diphosphate pyrophosphatase